MIKITYSIDRPAVLERTVDADKVAFVTSSGFFEFSKTKKGPFPDTTVDEVFLSINANFVISYEEVQVSDS